jgi:putative copper export protein
MLPVSWETIRLFFHVLAAAVWVGGQLTLAALVPALRGFGGEITKTSAQRFNRVAWPAFAVLVATGVWNMVAERDQIKGRYRTTLSIKLCLVLVSGVAAALHASSRSRTRLAVFGAASALSALAAMFLGILLAE